MLAHKAKLNAPLEIDVAEVASFFPEFRYRGPFARDFSSELITSEFIVNDADMHKCGFLYFDDKTEKGFTTITSHYTPKELAVFFSRLPENISKKLISALQGTCLEIPTLDESEKAVINREIQGKNEQFKHLKSIQAPLRNTQQINFTPHEAVTVVQHEYAIATFDSRQPVLGTFGAGPCVILALYDKENRRAMLAHIDSLTDLQSLSRTIQKFSSKNTIAHLLGGDSSSQFMCIELLEVLRKLNIEIENADLINHFNPSASLAIDSRTGAIYSPIHHSQLSKTNDLDSRLQMAGMGITTSPLTIFNNSLSQSPPNSQEQYSVVNKPPTGSTKKIKNTVQHTTNEIDARAMKHRRNF